MAVNASQLEEIAAWCSGSTELTTIRQEAHRTFFGEDDDQPIHYWPGAGEANSRQRRFIGWFMFTGLMPDGSRPAEYAAARLYQGASLTETVQAVQRTRYVLAIVTTVVPRQGVFLEVEDERFEVRDRRWAQAFARDRAVVTHLVPVRPGVWLPGPGWFEWPVRIGPNMRQDLKHFQLDPLKVERIMQMRDDPEADAIAREQPRDATLEQAVARMTEAAQQEGRSGLIMAPGEWKTLVLKHLENPNPMAFAQEVIQRAGKVDGVEDVNRWMDLAMNIWNTTPQPDRGGKTANELLGPLHER